MKETAVMTQGHQEADILINSIDEELKPCAITNAAMQISNLL